MFFLIISSQSTSQSKKVNIKYECNPLILVRLIPESVRWLTSQGRHLEANKVVEEIAKLNKVPVPHHLMLKVKNFPSFDAISVGLHEVTRALINTLYRFAAYRLGHYFE